MKPIYYIPIALVAIGVAYWSFSQKDAESKITRETEQLRQTLKNSEAKQKSESVAEMSRKLRAKLSSNGQPIDWKSLAAQLVEIQKSNQDSDDTVLDQFEKRLKTMSRDELIAALEEVSALGLNKEEFGLLEELLVEHLIEQDPAYCLEKYEARLENESDGVGWQLSSALGMWAKKDLAAATAWFDKKIAEGKFESKSLDGQSEVRLEFEASLIGELLASNPLAAGKRIAGLPEAQRVSAMQQIYIADLEPAAQKGYLELVRQLVPEDERDDALAQMASELLPDKNYSEMGDFLDLVKATPEERASIVKNAAGVKFEEISAERLVTRDDVEEFRAWGKKHSPAQVDMATGEALGEAIQEDGDFNFSKAAELALQYHKSTGKDDILVGFLNGFSSPSRLEDAKKLAQNIADPKRREEALSHLK